MTGPALKNDQRIPKKSIAFKQKSNPGVPGIHHSLHQSMDAGIPPRTIGSGGNKNPNNYMHQPIDEHQATLMMEQAIQQQRQHQNYLSSQFSPQGYDEQYQMVDY